MASKFTILLAAMYYFTTGTLAQSSCSNELMGLSPCLNYVTGNASAPSTSCCTQLASVVKSQPRCLCLLLNGGTSSVGITINQTRALALPDDCKVQTPPVSKCNSGQTPSATSPEGSPADSSNATPNTPETPSTSDTPAGRGSKTADSSDGVNTKASFQLIGLLVFVASYAFSAAAL